MNSILKSFLLVVAVSFSLMVSGQINYKKGYIITNKNDTIYGRIDDRGGYRNANICVFKAKDKPLVKFYPGDILAYRMFNDKYYVDKRMYVKGVYKHLFIDVLIKGDVSLYHFRKNRDMAYYIEKKDGKMVGLVNFDLILKYKPEGNIAVAYSPTYILHKKIYQDTLRSLFSDVKKIQDRIQKVEYDPKSLSKITKAYIKEKCKGNNCINYERDLHLYTPRLGVFAGIQFNDISFLPSAKGLYSKYDPSKIAAKEFTSNPIGLFVNFPLPMINDRLSFQIEGIWNDRHYQELLTNTTTEEFGRHIEINTQTISIPLLFKYQIGRGFISPSFAVGKETSYVYRSRVIIDENLDLRVHAMQKGGWLGEVGLNFKWTPYLTLFANLRYQMAKNQIIMKGNEQASYDTVLHSTHFVKEYETTITTFLFGLKF